MSNVEILRQKVLEQGGSFPIYLDNQSTTQIDPRVVEAMLPYFYNKFGNAHSRSHTFGWEAEEACQIARKQIADLIGANEKEIIFTSGATESNNIAIKGVAKFYSKQKRHIITVVTEHKCVIDSCRNLEQEGFKVTYLPVQKNGIIDLNKLEEAIREDTLLVSIMAVNNEIGVIQPLKEIGNICRKKNVFFHSDIAQGYGKIAINVNDMNIDLASISGHKIHGPKGIGVLYIRRKPRVRLTPLFSGGGQERGIRSGTLATSLIVGLGTASDIAKKEMSINYQHVYKLFNKFVSTIQNRADMIFLNGDRDQRYHGNVNLSFSYIEGESMILAVKELALSSGSACTSSSLEPSYVANALGIGDSLAHTSLRFGFSKFTTEAEIDFAIELLLSKIKKLRELSPLWEMVQEGIDINQIKWSLH